MPGFDRVKEPPAEFEVDPGQIRQIIADVS
jgi:hypothetical protein